MNQSNPSVKSYMNDYTSKLIPPEIIPEVEQLTQEEQRRQYIQNEVYEELIKDFSFQVANQASRNDMQNNEIVGGPFTYGEIDYLSLSNIVTVIQKRYNGLQGKQQFFIDLGSGCGKACLAAALLSIFHKSEGIEILEELHNLGLQLVEKINSSIEMISLKLTQIDTTICPIKLHNADFLKFDWSYGDLIFINATCYESEFLVEISERARNLKSFSFLRFEESFLVITTKKLPQCEEFLNHLTSFKRKMSWGSATVHIYQRK